MLAWADIGSGIGSFIGKDACAFSGMLIAFSQLSSFCWSTCVAYTLYNSMRQNYAQVEQQKVRMHFFA